MRVLLDFSFSFREMLTLISFHLQHASRYIHERAKKLRDQHKAQSFIGDPEKSELVFQGTG